MRNLIKFLMFGAVLSLVSMLNASELMLFDSLSVKGMGSSGCVSAVENDPDTLTVNPAGLASLSGVSGSANYILGIEGTSAMDITFGLPLGLNGGVLGANLSAMFINGIPNFDAVGTQLADLSAGDMMVTLGWGKTWGKKFSFGASAKIFSTKLDVHTGNTVEFDAGVQVNPIKHFNIGLSIQNLGPGQTFIYTSSFMPVKVRGGFCLTFVDALNFTASGALEVIDTSGEGLKTSLGLEMTVLKLLTFRAGYKVVNNGEYSLSAGFSLNYAKDRFAMGVDYALLPSSVFNTIHAFGVRFRL